MPTMMTMMMMVAIEEDGKRQGEDFGQVWMEKVEKPDGALQIGPLSQ